MAIDPKKTTILTLRRHKRQEKKSVFVTAYDYPQALLADKAGVDGILVGDSLGMTTLGHKTTIPVTMDAMILHAEAVARGAKSAFLVGDMPYMSYQASDSEAVHNAGRFIRAGMDAVKVEGAMVDLGLTPHTRAKLGGYRVQGKTAESTEIILNQALALQEAGCAFLLLEAMPRESAQAVAKELHIPVYGIGAGDLVDGQLVIMHDLVGLFWEFKSKFVKRYCEAGAIIQTALEQYADEVRTGVFPSAENFYEIKDEELEKLLSNAKWKYETDQGFPTNHSPTPNTVTPKEDIFNKKK